MPLESATYINSLNTSNPQETDPLSQADDHIKLIKTVLKTTFPYITGQVTATHDQLNEQMVVPGILGNGGTPTLATGVTGDEVKTLIGVVEPAITTNGSIPSLASGITAEEMRTLISAAPSSTPGYLEIYPVGSIYMTMDNNFNPNVTFGGTWARFAAGRMPIGVDANDNDFMTLGENSNFQGGGAKEVTLTEDQMPSHQHNSNVMSEDSRAYIGDTYALSHKGLDIGSYGALAPKTSNTGGDEAHPNMPPFIVVAMWQRMPDTP